VTKELYKKLDLDTKALAMDAKEPFTSISIPFPFPKVFRDKMLHIRDWVRWVVCVCVRDLFLFLFLSIPFYFLSMLANVCPWVYVPGTLPK
jgi:hypothetical protein